MDVYFDDDALALYELSVTATNHDISFISSVFSEAHGGRAPLRVREDFCGTALLAAEWVRRDARHSAVAVDNCARTIDWARTHNVDRIAAIVEAGDEANDTERGAAARASFLERLELVCSDVCAVDAKRAKVDVVVAGNYSFFVFKRRAALLDWLRSAHAALEPGGMLFLEMIGGTTVMDAPSLDPARRINVVAPEHVDPATGAVVGGERSSAGVGGEHPESSNDRGFVYQWEQCLFNPVDNTTLCKIHFAFDDGRTYNDAFVYDWRVWTPVELREAMEEVGFASTKVLWEVGGDSDDEEDEEEEEEEVDEGEVVVEPENAAARVAARVVETALSHALFGAHAHALGAQLDTQLAATSRARAAADADRNSIFAALEDIVAEASESRRRKLLGEFCSTAQHPSLFGTVACDSPAEHAALLGAASGAPRDAIRLGAPPPPPAVSSPVGAITAEVAAAAAVHALPCAAAAAVEELDSEFVDDACHFVETMGEPQQPSWNAWLVATKSGGVDSSPWGLELRPDGRVAISMEEEEEGGEGSSRADANEGGESKPKKCKVAR